MRLFRRKPIADAVTEGCPQCAERIPNGANECRMCGADLRPLRSSSRTPQVERTSSES